jgi:hypothetical protein
LWRRIVGLTAVLACGLVGVAEGQPRPDVTSWVTPDTVQRGEPFTLIVTANTPAHRAVGFPKVPTDSSVFGPLRVQRRSRTYTRRVGGLYAIDSVAYTVTTIAPDSVRIPPLPIRIDAGVGTLVTRTRPRVVQVAAAPPHPLLGIVKGGPGPARAWGWAALIVALAAGAGSGFYLWARRRTNKTAVAEGEAAEEKIRTAQEASAGLPAETERRLDELESADPTDPEAVTELYVELAAVVRTVLTREFDLSGQERTTADLRAMLDRHDEVPPSATGALQNVLEEAELVKYAGRRPDAETARRALRAARTGLRHLADAPAPDAS